MRAATLAGLGWVLAALSCQLAGCASPPAESALEIDLATLAIERQASPDVVARIETRLARARSGADPAELIEPLVALAMLDRAGRDVDAAERRLAQARNASSDSTPAALRGWLDSVAAAVALDRNRPEEAVELAGNARRAFASAGDRRGAVEAATLLITARGIFQARFEEALALVDSCLESAAASGEELMRLRCVNARASLVYNLADYETAVRDYTEVASSSSPLPEKIKSTAQLNLALCHIHLGEYAAARLAIEDALAAARIPGRTEYPEAVPLYYRGYLLARLGDHEGAFEDYLAALALFRRDENRYFESFLLIDIGDNLLLHGRPQRAIQEYETSREIYRASGNPRGSMLVEEGIGRALLDLGDDEQAQRRLGRALELAGEVGDDHGWARIAAVLGDRLLRRTAPAEAEALLQRAAEVAAAKGLLEEQFRAMLGLSRVRRDLLRRDDALAGYRATLDLLDRIRDQLSSESQHLTFSESRHVAYREAVDLLLDGQRDDAAVAEAFSIAERARARALLELMQHARLAGATRTARLRRERLAILARLSRAQSTLLAATESDGQARRDFRRATEDLERFDLEEAARLPSTAAPPQPLDLDAVRRHVATGRLLAVYWIGPGGSYLWRIRDGVTSLTELPGFDALAPAIETYHSAIAREPGWDNPAQAWRRPAESLARLLRIDRLVDGAGGGTLMVVPDGPLHGVPLEPLIIGTTDTGRALLLGDRFELVYLPSASFLSLERPAISDRPPRVLALGDPQAPPPAVSLPGAREEVRRIARLFDDDRARVRVGARAAKRELRTSAAAAADILHFAARTVTPENGQGSTGIALAPDAAGDDGLLRPREIASLELRARLAVLSACGTGLGRPVAGEGLHGLARAFLIAGVPAIVPSQWDVSDRATVELMERFYRGLAAGEPAHRALARAARELRRDSLPLYAHPHYWAPFVVFGLPPDPA